MGIVPLESGPLDVQATKFAQVLDEVLQAAIVDCPPVTATRSPDGTRYHVSTSDSSFDVTAADIPLKRACDLEAGGSLFLRLNYVVSLEELHPSGGDRYMQVDSSVIGLYVARDSSPPRPLIRVEYEREMEGTPLPSAHVHLHAESEDLKWIYDSEGTDPRMFQQLHFPVGGRRYRPTVEEFCFFLNKEKLFTEWRDGWRAKFVESLDRFRKQQLAAAIRSEEEVAIKVLEHRQYVVTKKGEQT